MPSKRGMQGECYGACCFFVCMFSMGTKFLICSFRVSYFISAMLQSIMSWCFLKTVYFSKLLSKDEPLSKTVNFSSTHPRFKPCIQYLTWKIGSSQIVLYFSFIYLFIFRRSCLSLFPESYLCCQRSFLLSKRMRWEIKSMGSFFIYFSYKR